MSSPLPRLKRARRTPLLNKTTSYRRDDQHDTIIYKTNSFQTATAALSPYITSSKDTTTGIITDCSSVDDQIINGLTRDSIPNDNCLLTSMATRLLMIERELLSSKREIIEKDNRITSLEELLVVKNTTSTTQLESKCTQLQQQVNEMKKFLNDYGMEWIGDNDHTHNDTTMWSPHSSIVTTPPIDDVHIDHVIDFDKLISAIKELNIIAGEDTSIVCKNEQGAMLKETGSIPLILYMNGLVMFQGPFRPYSDPMTQMCINDIMEGYFPSELQYRYPDGIPFKVTDMRSHSYHSPPRNSQALFPGKGYSLKNTSTDNEPHPLININSIVTHKPHPLANCYNENTQTVEKFLSRLPNKVIKNGKVINIHSELRDSLQDGPIINLTTDSDDSGLSNSNEEIILLRIRLTDNQQVILKMTITNTVKELRQRIDMLRSHDMSHDYNIKTCHPNRTLTNNNQTLLQYGITCSCNIYIQSVTTAN